MIPQLMDLDQSNKSLGVKDDISNYTKTVYEIFIG